MNRQISIRDIDAENFIDAIRLEVKPEQEAFVASNAASIAQSKFHTFLECVGIYADDTMVGFSAFGRNPDDREIWIARHMIGAEHQGQGHGRAGLQALIDHMREMYACADILYKSAGFIDTGRTQGKSQVYRLELTTPKSGDAGEP